MKVLKRLRESDLYTGMIVASDGNLRHLYELVLVDDCVRYKAVAFINDAGVVEKKGDGSWFSTNMHNDNSISIWCETEDSRRLDTASRREDRLKELGI
jgi:hypothetical protein